MLSIYSGDQAAWAARGTVGRQTVGSLFSGIGGLDHGLACAGWEHVFLCESDPWRRDVLRARFPGVPVHDDVRSVGLEPGTQRSDAERTDGADLGAGRGDTSPVDLLCGGFPCQDLSVAGQRRGLDGSRSGLFYEFARIIDAFRPRWILVENVPGLLSSQGGRDFGTVLGTLADIGYGVAWRVLDSRFFGVPQRRRRVFIVGTLAHSDSRAAAERAGAVLAVGARCPRHPATRGETREDAADPFAGGAGDGEPPMIPALAMSVVSSGGNDKHDVTRMTYVTAFHQTQEPIHGSDFSPALGATSIGMGVGQGASVRRLTPTECERLQALPDGWTNPDGTAPDSRRYAGLGDAVTASVGEWIGRRILEAM